MLLILFHNYSHVILPWEGENEFAFSYNNVTSFIKLLVAQPLDILRLLFAYLGHYGVEIFVFISGYGLYLSYNNRVVTGISFIKKHLIKIYPAYIIAIILFLISTFIHHGNLNHPHLFKYAFLDLLFIQNFVPGAVYELSGPWWFFSLIMQLYAIFPLLLGLLHRYNIKSIIIVGFLSWIIAVMLTSTFDRMELSIYHTFIGWMPVFCLGMFFAYLQNFKLPWVVVAISFLVFVAGNVFETLWPLTMMSITILLLVTGRFLSAYFAKLKYTNYLINLIGVNSLYIFAVHGYLRWPFANLATSYGNPLWTILLGIAFLFTSIIIGLAVRLVESKIRVLFFNSSPSG